MRPTPSFGKPTLTDRALYLHEGQAVYAVADRCREAGVEFARGTTGGWGARELATWLVDHYEPATAATRTLVKTGPRPASGEGGVDTEALERVVLDARARLFEMLATSASAWASDSFARAMVDGMLVVGVQDQNGAIGYAPVRYAEMRLVDRVISLFVADYLTRPTEYQDLVTCEECGAIAFDGTARHAAWCEDPPILSNIVPAHPAVEVGSRDTIPGLSDAPTAIGAKEQSDRESANVPLRAVR